MQLSLYFVADQALSRSLTCQQCEIHVAAVHFAGYETRGISRLFYLPKGILPI